MPLAPFILFTTLGALAWNCILALLGWLAYKAAKPALIEQYSNILSYAIIAIVAVFAAFFIIRHIVKKKSKATKS